MLVKQSFREYYRSRTGYEFGRHPKYESWDGIVGHALIIMADYIEMMNNAGHTRRRDPDADRYGGHDDISGF